MIDKEIDDKNKEIARLQEQIRQAHELEQEVNRYNVELARVKWETDTKDQ